MDRLYFRDGELLALTLGRATITLRNYRLDDLYRMTRREVLLKRNRLIINDFEHIPKVKVNFLGPAGQSRENWGTAPRMEPLRPHAADHTAIAALDLSRSQGPLNKSIQGHPDPSS
ncbi:MAG: hypothetical protein ACYC5H_12550 [Methylovirgula sp.]